MAKRSGPQRKRNITRPGRLRIVAGKWRSRLLPIADVPGLRPTSERIRETLFNWLSPGIEGSRCLDLFAGSGALGFEALSRGAAAVTFVDSSAAAIANLQQSAVALGATGANIVKKDGAAFLDGFSGEKYDLVFLDPPFSGNPAVDLCRLLANSNVLADGAQIYLERERGQVAPDLPDGWFGVHGKIAGNVSYSLYGTAPKESGK